MNNYDPTGYNPMLPLLDTSISTCRPLYQCERCKSWYPDNVVCCCHMEQQPPHVRVTQTTLGFLLENVRLTHDNAALRERVPGFTLVHYIQILPDGSNHESSQIFTDGTSDLEEWKNNKGLKFLDWDERHYSFVDGKWTEDAS